MPSTLISLIGTAQLAPGEATYVTTIYDLPDGNRSRPVSLLAAAVQEQERCERVVFLGTRTSAWATLIDACCPDQVELFERLYAAQREPGGVPDDLLTATASAVGAMLRAEVACQALCLRDVDDGNAAGIIATMAAVIPDKGGIILDVTHAFRSIALLMLAALHLKDAVSPGVVARTEVQYGDLVTRPASKATEAKSGPAVGQGRVVALTSLTRAGALAGALTAAERSLQGAGGVPRGGTRPPQSGVR
jgi:CRISPR-associated DxTHG motif protein